jgi:hypothetical protein
MLYLGHFSLDRLERRRRASAAWHGYFTCVVEAADMDDALAHFHRFIATLRETDGELFEDVTEVHLEACVEIRSVPRTGFLAFYNLLEGENRGGMSTAIRGATEREAVAVRIGAPDEQDSDEAHEVEPFIVFQRTRGRHRRPSASAHG